MHGPVTLVLSSPLSLARGSRVIIGHGHAGLGGAVLDSEAPLPRHVAGTFLGENMFQIRSVMALPAVSPAVPASRAYLLEAVDDLTLPPGRHPLPASTRGLTLAWVTLSDKGSRGEREDKSGPLIACTLGAAMSLSLVQGHILPDDALSIRALLTDLALTQGFDLIVTTGGTGLAPRDVTADVTATLVEKRLYGFEQLMLQASLAKTPHGAISRAVAGTLGRSLILNLPGSPKAVVENLEPLLPVIPHALDKLKGDPSECARL